MSTSAASHGFGPGRIGMTNPAQLLTDQCVSSSVTDKEATASRSHGGSVLLQREAGPPLSSPMPTAPMAPAATAAPKKGKGKKK